MRKFVTSTALFGSLILLSPAPALAATLVPMDQDGVNVRSGPGLNYQVIGGIAAGQSATVLARAGDWYKVQLANGTVGYVAGWVSFVRYDDEHQLGIVTTDVLNVRNAPSFSGQILGTLKNGQQFRVLEVQPNWWQIEYNGTPAWVSALYVRLVDDSASGGSPASGAGNTPDPADSGAGDTGKSGNSGTGVSVIQVSSVTREIRGNSIVYRFATTGTTTPSTSDDGEYVTITIPGTRLNATLPEGVTGVQNGDSVTVRVHTAMAYSLKRVPGGFELHLYPSIEGRTIVVDPGHGGADPGAVNRSLGLREKDITLNVALKLRDYLEGRGANVILTRESDVHANYPEAYSERSDLAARSKISNDGSADLFLSIHINSASASATGSETYYCSDNYNAERSKYFAALVQQALVDSLDRLNRGVKDYDFYVVKYTDAPAALAELAFISNPEEAALLADETVQQTLAANLADAIEQFFAPRGGTPADSTDSEGASDSGLPTLTPYDLEYYVAAIQAEKATGLYQPLDTYVNGQKVAYDVRPLLMRNRTMVPIRAVAEALGAEVIWSEDAPDDVWIVRGDTTIHLVIGSNEAVVNGKTVQLDVPATLIADARVVVPLRFVSEQLGMKVAWLADDQVIVITDRPVQGYDYMG